MNEEATISPYFVENCLWENGCGEIICEFSFDEPTVIMILKDGFVSCERYRERDCEAVGERE